MPWLGYRRVSRVGKDREEYLPDDYKHERDWQSQKINPYAKTHKLDIETLDPELDVSGGKTDRPILNEAIKRIEQGDAEGLIVAQLDRLSRAGIEDSLKVIRQVEAGGGKVIAVAENFDDSTPEGRMTRNVMLSLAEMQLDRSKESFMHSKQRSVREGVWPIAVVPFGFDCKRKKDGGDGKLYPNEDARKVKKAFKAKAAGKSWREVADILGNGISGAQKIIENPVYLGEVRLAINGEPAVNPDAHPEVIDRATFEAAQPQKRARRVPKDSPALLGGIVRCAECSRVMSLGVFANGHRSYRCNTRNSSAGDCKAPAIIGQNVIEPYVEELVLPWLEKVFVKSRPKTDHLAEALGELESAEAELATYQKAMKGLPAEQLQAGLTERIADMERARDKVREIQRGSEPMPVTDTGSLAEAWPEMSVPEKNLILRAALGTIWANKGGASIPVADKVRVIERGFEPELLSGPGRGRNVPLVRVPNGKLKGQISASLG